MIMICKMYKVKQYNCLRNKGYLFPYFQIRAVCPHRTRAYNQSWERPQGSNSRMLLATFLLGAIAVLAGKLSFVLMTLLFMIVSELLPSC